MKWSLAIIAFVSIFLIVSYWKVNTPRFLTFSDAAKFADIGRNVLEGKGFLSEFTYPDKNGGIPNTSNGLFAALWVPPLFPLSLAIVFRFLGTNDLSVVFTSSVFFIGSVILLFLLGKKIYSPTVGLISALSFAASLPFLGFATQGASETLLVFEIVAGALLFSLKNKAAFLLGIVCLISMYFTRPQGFIYIIGLLIFTILLNSNSIKKVITLLVLVTILFCGFEIFSRSHIGSNFLYSITTRGVTTLPLFTQGTPNNAELRGGQPGLERYKIGKNIKVYLIKIFYNLYNFYKLTPQIISPYFATLFWISLLRKEKNKTVISFKYASVFMVGSTLLVTAASIPFFRYIHPITPLIYLFSASELVQIINNLIKSTLTKTAALCGVLFIFIFGSTIGNLILDSRFTQSNLINKNKPPIYYILATKLKDLTQPQDVIITNLDTWGSWYGNRRTVWFPLDPSQVEPQDGRLAPDAIFLTTYKADDPNYLMGKNWKEIVNNPENIKFEYISKNYHLKSKFKTELVDNYEKIEAESVLLVRK